MKDIQKDGLFIHESMIRLLSNGIINVRELHVLALIQQSSFNGLCILSNKEIGEYFGLKEKSISNLIARLKNKNLIEQVRFDGRTRWLKLIF